MTKEELRKIKEIYARNHFLGISAEALILEVERLQSEIERLQSEREWRPIETVPEEVKKYGTRILVFGSKMHGLTPLVDQPPPEVYEVRWFKWYGDEPGWMLANCDEEYGHCIDATLWMPLPDSHKGGKE